MISLRRTKVIFTYGPSCKSDKILERLMLLADGIRLNFSHGSLEEKDKVISRVREIEGRIEKYTSIIADLQGGCIRLGDFGEVRIIKGRNYKFGIDSGIIIPSREVFGTVDVDDLILVDDGRFRFRVVKVSGLSFIAKAEISGVLGSRKTFLIKEPVV